MPLEAALTHLAQAHRTAAQHLSALIAIDTTYPPGENYPTLVAWAETHLTPLGYTCRRIDVPEPLWNVPHAGAHGRRTNLIATLNNDAPELGIYAHMDVVPAGDGWDTPPFSPATNGNDLHGRGAADMKASIAALILALETAQTHNLPLRYAPKILLTTDEEGGAYPGIRYLAEQGHVPLHLLCLDGSPAPRLWAGSFGSLELLLEIHGRAGHAGQKGSGDNALERAIPILAALLALKSHVESRPSALHGSDGRPLHPILAITTAQAGTKANSIPAHCTIGLNRRYAPEETDTAVLAEIARTIAQAAPPGTNWRLHTTGHLAAVKDAHLGPHWPRWTSAMAASFGWNPADARPYGSTSSSDMGWVQRARAPHETPEILIGGAIRPDSRVHAPNERVAIPDVLALAAAILRYLATD
jgi:succinyl-diaminopimelate desuccinylase